MDVRFRISLISRDLPKIRQPTDAAPSTINAKTLADFTRVVEQTGIFEARGAEAEIG